MANAPAYGIKHTPVIATIIASRTAELGIIAQIGDRHFHFENGTQPIAIGSKIEVMFTRSIEPQIEAANDNTPANILVRPVDTDKHMLVAINGFEYEGIKTGSTSLGIPTDGRGTKSWNWMTDRDTTPRLNIIPGRTAIKTADNLSTFTYERQDTPRTPTNVWIARSSFDNILQLTHEVIGLTRFEDGQWADEHQLAQAA